jgi:hypothetical protein
MFCKYRFLFKKDLLGRFANCSVDEQFMSFAHHDMNTYEGMEVWLHVFLTSASNGGEWLMSHPVLPLRKKPHGTHCIGEWVRPRTSPDMVGIKSCLSISYPYHYTD